MCGRRPLRTRASCYIYIAYQFLKRHIIDRLWPVGYYERAKRSNGELFQLGMVSFVEERSCTPNSMLQIESRFVD